MKLPYKENTIHRLNSSLAMFHKDRLLETLFPLLYECKGIILKQNRPPYKATMMVRKKESQKYVKKKIFPNWWLISGQPQNTKRWQRTKYVLPHFLWVQRQSNFLKGRNTFVLLGLLQQQQQQQHQQQQQQQTSNCVVLCCVWHR